MALFGKKKGDAPDNKQTGNQNGESPTTESGAFDFDSIARDLEAQDGPSPFDELLSKPATNDVFNNDAEANMEEISGSAFDFPEAPLEVEDDLPARKVVAMPSDDLDNLDDLFGQSPAQPASTSVPPSDSFPDLPLSSTPAVAPSNVPPPVTPSTATVVSAQPQVKVKKPFPLIPALGALAVLVIAGGAGLYFLQPGEEEPAPIAAPITTTPETAPVAGAPTTPPVPPSPAQIGNAPTPPAAPAPVTNPAPAVNPPALVAPAPVEDPQVLGQLKTLWEQGKEAKARGDYAAARQFWQQALTLKPGHPGFQESIDKLPPTP